MTVTAKKLAANRANAKKSTGPRTAAGKKKCSKNAVTHGIFCNDVVLPGEDAKIFESLRHAVLLKLCPQDIVELMIVDRIVIAQWKLRRLNSVEATAHMGIHQARLERQRRELDKDQLEEFDPDEPEKRDPTNELTQELIDAEERNPDLIQAIAVSVINDDGMLERLSRYEQRLELTIHRNLRQLEKLRKQSQSERSDSGAPPVARCPFLPGDEYETARTLMRKHDRNEQNRAKEPDDGSTSVLPTTGRQPPRRRERRGAPRDPTDSCYDSAKLGASQRLGGCILSSPAETPLPTANPAVGTAFL